MSSKALQSHIACPDCGSSDAMTIYSDGHSTCYACNQTRIYNNNNNKEEVLTVKEEVYKPNNLIPLGDSFKASRGISQKTFEKYQVWTQGNDQYYPYFDDKGHHVANKIRQLDVKGFMSNGDYNKGTLFGQQLFPAGSAQQITLVEGECFPFNAEVLTPVGWKKFIELGDEEVYQVDEKLQGSFVKPLHKICKEYTGLMIEHSIKGYYSLTTENHNLVSLTHANKLVKHEAKNVKSWNNIPRSSFYEGPGVDLSEDQIDFCLALSADATFDERANGETYVRISFKKKRKIERFSKLLSNLNIQHTATTHKNGLSFFGFIKPAWAIKRFFPVEWFSLLSYSQRVFLLENLIHWDGNSVPNRQQTEYSSKYKHNADFIQTVAHTIGIVSSIIPRENSHGKWFKVSILWGKSTSSWQSVTTKKFFTKDLVYCVTVPSGMLLIRQKDKITVTGNCDAMAAYEMQGSKFPVVSIKSASTAEKDVAYNFEYLNSFGKIVICFDKDTPHKKPDGTVWYPGQEAALKVASMFELGKVRLLTLQQGKDANEYLEKGLSKQFVEEWWKAREWSPVGLQHAKDCWDDVLLAKQTKYESIPWPYEGLNELTYGLRPSELVTITANPKVGKTAILRETIHHILQNLPQAKEGERQKRIGVMFLEEPKKDTLLGLMSLTANKPLHLPDILEQVSEEELKKYFDAVYKDDKLILWNHFGSNNINTVLNYIRYMHNLGCSHIILDHLSIIVSDQDGDERKRLDEITTKIKTLTIELGICVIVVIHQNRAGQIRGTAGVEQLSNIVIKLYRDMLADDEDIRNTMKIVVEMNRFSGKTGPAAYLRYDGETGRLTEIPKELWGKLEEGNKDNGEDW